MRLWNGYEGGDTTSHTVTETEAPIITFINDTPTATTNKITVEVKAEDDQAGMPEKPEYTYKIGTTQGGEYIEGKAQISNNTRCEFTGLAHDTDYYITVTVKDLAGNTGRKESGVIHIIKLPDAGPGEGSETGETTYTNFSWPNG